MATGDGDQARPPVTLGIILTICQESLLDDEAGSTIGATAGRRQPDVRSNKFDASLKGIACQM